MTKLFNLPRATLAAATAFIALAPVAGGSAVTKAAVGLTVSAAAIVATATGADARRPRVRDHRRWAKPKDWPNSR